MLMESLLTINDYTQICIYYTISVCAWDILGYPTHNCPFDNGIQWVIVVDYHGILET